jgi:uncharacterized protein YndB with AHSA1/START domain
MTARSAIHDTFAIERTYNATPSQVFGAFSSQEAKNAWSDTGDTDPGSIDGGQAEFDFRIGGRERLGFSYQGRAYRYDALYYDIVPEQRIIYSYEMYADDVRISVSVATIELSKADNGTVLTWTEQGTYLDGFDGPAASQLRWEGTNEMLDCLTQYFASWDAA